MRVLCLRYYTCDVPLPPGTGFNHSQAVAFRNASIGGATEYDWGSRTGGAVTRRSDIYNTRTKWQYEIKTGKQSLSKALKSQIKNDIKLSARGVHTQWEFFPGITGGIQATLPLQKALADAKITMVFHIWAQCKCGGLQYNK
jgi:hypothetical protein